MIVAIHQPNYLPWSGFFDKMARCDRFVFLDTVPFSKHGYQNRSRVKGSGGPAWLTVPVLTHGHFGDSTQDIRVDAGQRWAPRHWRTLEQSYGRCPHFGEVAAVLRTVYERSWERLVDLNAELITRIAAALGISTPVVWASALGVEGRRSELLAAICRALGATTYLSGPSGASYLDEEPFRREGIGVTYHAFAPQPYPQRFPPFAPGLSVVDAWANCGTYR